MYISELLMGVIITISAECAIIIIVAAYLAWRDKK